MGAHGTGDHKLGTRPVYRLSSAVCLGQNHRGSKDQEWSLENRRERIEHLSEKGQVTFECDLGRGGEGEGGEGGNQS